MEAPCSSHIHTVKGKGYKPAEQAPDKFHGVGCFDPAPWASLRRRAVRPLHLCLQQLISTAKDRPDILAITAAMPSGTGLKAFGQAYPKPSTSASPRSAR